MAHKIGKLKRSTPTKANHKKPKSSGVNKPQRQNRASEKEFLLRNRDLPVSFGHLDAFKKEINSKLITIELRIAGQGKKVDAEFHKLEARFSEIDASFHKVEARFKEIDASFDKVDARFKEIDERFIKMDAKLEIMAETMQRMAIAFEEQNTRNKLVMDNLNMLYARQDRLELETNERLKNMESLLMRPTSF